MTSTSMLDRSVKSRRDMAESGSGSAPDSKHFTSLQIFTSFAEPPLNEFFTQKEQQDLEQRQRDEEDKLYRYDGKRRIFFSIVLFNTSLYLSPGNSSRGGGRKRRMWLVWRKRREM